MTALNATPATALPPCVLSEQWNDAIVVGDDCPEWQALLNREVTFFVGSSGKLTKWPAVTAAWRDWIEGGKDGGFSIHRASKKKSSRAVVMASFTGTARKADAVTHLHALALDFDSGTSRADVEERIEDLGVAAIVYTSHSDQKTRSKVNHKALERAFPDLDPAEINDSMLRLFLRDHSPTVWSDDHIDSATIVEADGTTDDGPVVWYDHAPLDKFRVVFPLAESVTIKDLGRDQQARKTIWADKVTGAARVWLDGHFDRSCTDLSRQFYMPEHPPGASGHITIFRAPPARFEDIPTYSKKDYAAEFAPVAHRKNGGEAVLPSGELAKVWAAQNDHAFRLELGKMIDDNAPGRVRDDKGNGLYVVECPFEEMHGEWGGTGTHVRDAEGEGLGGFSFECKHDSCAGLDRLDLLAAALERWDELDENWIWSDADEGGYLLEAGEVIEDDDDGVIEEEADDGQADTRTPALAGPEKLPFSAQVETRFKDDADDASVVKFLRKTLRCGVDTFERQRITDALFKVTGLGKRAIAKLWKQAEREEAEHRKANDPEADAKPPAVNEADFHEIVEYAESKIAEANEAEPRLFHYMEELASIRTNERGVARIKMTNETRFTRLLNTVAVFQKAVGDNGARQGVSAPRDVVLHILGGDYDSYPPLRGVVTSPVFSAGGSMITEKGYHSESGLYYQPPATLKIPEVSDVPTTEDVTEAKRLLIEECFADFPFGGLARQEIVEQALEGDGVASVTNAVALTLLPFMREMVDGPTPGHLLTKPAPGTGASLLTDVVSIIATGDTTPAMAMPGNKDEMSKTLTSLLADGRNVVFFDNINHTVDSGELASAMTTPTYSARILGKSQTVETEVRCVWILTGNKVKLSNELVRRLILLDLDAHMINPELRTEFRHSDIRGWAREHRGELVWACLTLIQNWVAQGMKPNRARVLASYESWSAVMGGVLHAAGLGQFMGNAAGLQDAKATKRTGEDDLMAALVSEFENGQWFRLRGQSDYRPQGGTAEVPTLALFKWINDFNKTQAEEDSDGDSGAMFNQIRLSGGGYDDIHNEGQRVARYKSSGTLSDALDKYVVGSLFAVDGAQVELKREHDNRNGGPVYQLVINPLEGTGQEECEAA